MRVREVGWLIFLAGLPFAHFLFRPLDPWHGQAVWAQGWIFVLFALSLGSDTHLRANQPLGAFIAWMSLLSLWMWVKTIADQKLYPLPMLQGLMHLVLLVMAYYAACTTWTGPFLVKLTRWIAYGGLVVLGYCGLQLLNLDQFFKSIAANVSTDTLVGTMGNPQHLAAQLAFLLPFFLLQPRRRWWWASGVTVALLALTGSAAGQLSAFLAVSWWAWHRQKRLLWVVGVVGVASMAFVAWHPTFLNPHGRLRAWGTFYELFQAQPITGRGAGFVMEFSRTITDGTHPFFGWRHVHNEYFQAAIEYGLIGLGLIGWMIWDTGRLVTRLPKSPMVVALAGTLIAFGVNSCLNFPAHLWVTGSYALVAYCGLRVLEQEVRMI